MGQTKKTSVYHTQKKYYKTESRQCNKTRLAPSWTWRELNEPAVSPQTYILAPHRILQYGNEPSASMSALFTFTHSAFVIWNVVGVYIKDLVKLQRNNKYKCSWHVMRLITSAVMVEHVVFSSETTAKYSCAFLYKDLSNTHSLLR